MRELLRHGVAVWMVLAILDLWWPDYEWGSCQYVVVEWSVSILA